MRIRHWPQDRPEDFRNGPVASVLQVVQERDPQLWALVWDRLREAGREETQLAQFERQGWAERLRYTEGLYEFKFPPTRRQGVVRIYFCCDPNVRNCIWLLEAEYKTGGGKKQHKAILKSAEQKCREIRR